MESLKKGINVLALILILVGALNWGLWGFFQFDLVAWLFKGNTTMISRAIYAVIGLAGVWGLRFLCHCCHSCACGCCHNCSCQGSCNDEMPKSGKGKGKGGCCKM